MNLRQVALLVAAWLGILLPTVAGVQVATTLDPTVRAALASLCLTPGSSGPDLSGDSDAADQYRCFFCYPSTNAAQGSLAPAEIVLAVPEEPVQVWAAPLPDVHHPPTAPAVVRARGPPLSPV